MLPAKRIFTFPSADGQHTLTGESFLPAGVPVGAVLIIHGMDEYFGRYDATARYLAENGFVASGHDHLGHKSAATDPRDLGFFAPQDGWQYLVADAAQHLALLQAEYPGLPIFILGHSMGSFVARILAAREGRRLAGAVFSGTGGPNPAAKAGITAADLVARSLGCRHRSRLLKAMAFAGYDKGLRGEPANSWLTRDPAVVARYNADPYCTFLFTASAFRDLFTLYTTANDPATAAATPRDLPVLLLSGDRDPVGAFGAGPAAVARQLKASGVFDCSCKLFPGGRHEMLNEINGDEVRAFLLRWLQQKLR